MTRKIGFPRVILPAEAQAIMGDHSQEFVTPRRLRGLAPCACGNLLAVPAVPGVLPGVQFWTWCPC